MNTTDYYNSVKWMCTVGVNSGYNLEDQQKMPVEQLTSLYLKIADDVMQQTGVYISAVVAKSRTLYSPAWGCPESGEFSYTLSGSCNPEFAKKEEYLSALEVVVKKLKTELKQSTLLLEIVPVHLQYYKE